MTVPTQESADAGARLETLEFKVAHLERALQELSDVVYRQQQLLAAADTRYQRLLERVEAGERGVETAGGFEVPPHY